MRLRAVKLTFRNKWKLVLEIFVGGGVRDENEDDKIGREEVDRDTGKIRS